ncbi:hypothetical protein RhiirC2_790967, partial [Rhizophagus irregularis]
NQEKLKGKHHAPGSKAWFTAIKERKSSAECIVEHAQYTTERTARAKLWSTSFKSIEHREGMVKDLTDFQNHFHKKITALTNRRTVLHAKLDKGKSDSISNIEILDQSEQEFAQLKTKQFISKSTKQLERLEQDFVQFKIDYFSVMNRNADHYRYKGYTSDDTKELELRPRKRP